MGPRFWRDLFYCGSVAPRETCGPYRQVRSALQQSFAELSSGSPQQSLVPDPHTNLISDFALRRAPMSYPSYFVPPEVLEPIIYSAVARYLDDIIAGPFTIPTALGPPDYVNFGAVYKYKYTDNWEKWKESETRAAAVNPVTSLLKASRSLRTITLRALSAIFCIDFVERGPGR